MSIKIMSLVWERAPYTAGSLLVLLALADWCNDDGVCWPSIPTIAAKTRLERRSIQYIIRQLKGDAIIAIEEGRGRGHQHRYTVNVQNLRLLPNLIKGEIDDSQKVQTETQKAQSTTEKVQPIAPDPLIEPSVEPNTKPLDKTQEFFSSLKTNPAYSFIDIDREVGRMQAWLMLPANKGRQCTPRFVLNWLNKIERPMTLAAPNGNGNGHANRYRLNDASEVCLRCNDTGVEITEKGSRPCRHNPL